ncbi:hypothetical protein GCM10028805_26190 [Spirosoma harenae]
METLDSILTIAYIATNVLSVGQMVCSYRWPILARGVFLVLFGVAAFFNTQTALDTPWVYQDFANWAGPLYRWFILGPFEKIIQPMVLSIVVGQFLIAGSMMLRGKLFRIGCLAGILFCVAITPLGIGSAFPAPLLLAFSFYQLYKRGNSQIIQVINQSKNILSKVD